MSYMIYFFLNFFFLLMLNCQKENLSLLLNTPTTASIKTNGNTNYYTLEIPMGIAVNATNLVIRVKEDDDADIGKDDFSDPDLYVSKVNNKIPFR